jgi:predicted AAA+ superfamily ATPase
MIERAREFQTVKRLLDRYPVVGITGARQVGKTTLARAVAARWKGPVTRFDLENPQDVTRLTDPLLALQELKGLVIIAEPLSWSSLERFGIRPFVRRGRHDGARLP